MFEPAITPVINLLNSLMGPLLAIISSLGALYCVVLGVKYAKADEPQEREKAKGALKNAVIGFVMIFVLILGLNILMPIMTNWVNDTILRNKPATSTGSTSGLAPTSIPPAPTI